MVGHRAIRPSLTILTFILLVPFGWTQPAEIRPATPQEIFQSAQEQIQDGRYDVAAQTLKQFLRGNPTEQDFRQLQENDPAVFQKLRNVVKWSDDPKVNADAQATVEQVVQQAEAANARFFQDPTRIQKFVNNLGQSTEERIFAEIELRKSGSAVVPYMVSSLRTTSDPAQKAGIYLTIRNLNLNTIPGFLAAAEGLSPDLTLGLLNAIANRSDLLQLLTYVETDITPYLWYYSATRDETTKPLREYCSDLLRSLTSGKSAQRIPSHELTVIAASISGGEKPFLAITDVTLWEWNQTKLQLESASLPKPKARTFYALETLKQAIQVDPTNIVATDLYARLATRKTVAESSYGSLAEADPQLFAILAALPRDRLLRMLDTAIRDKDTAVVLGVIQVIAVRSDPIAVDKEKESASENALVRALDYPDPRVQFAAAIGLLNIPGVPSHGRTDRIVEILARALSSAQTNSNPGKLGLVLVIDPDSMRAAKTTRLLAGLGFGTKTFLNGQTLLRNVREEGDFRFVLVDRHVANPQIRYLLAQLQADLNVAGRPVLVVASTDEVQPPQLEQLLLRLAALIAVTDDGGNLVPTPFAFDPRRPVPDLEAARIANAAKRDLVLQELYAARLARLERLVEAANLRGIGIETRLKYRIPQATLATLVSQFNISETSAPELFRQYTVANNVLKNLSAYTSAGLRLDVLGLPTIVDQLETGVDAERLKQFETLHASIDRTALSLPPDSSRDALLERDLRRITKNYAIAEVIPEPFSLVSLRNDLEEALNQPVLQPQAESVSAANAQLAAQWLQIIGLGQVTGYDLRPAETALRAALNQPSVASQAIDALSRVPSAETQQDLLNVALTEGRPDELRIQAANRTIDHIQRFGKLIPVSLQQALANANPKSNALLARLAVIRQLLDPAGQPVPKMILNYNPIFVTPPAAKPMPKK